MIAADFNFDPYLLNNAVRSATAILLESSERRKFLILQRSYPLLENFAEKTRANAEVLGIDIGDDTYEHWTHNDLEMRAETARLIRRILIEGTLEEITALRIGAARQNRRPRGGKQKIKPGPKERSMEEVTQIVHKWRDWQKRGYTQQEFCDFELAGSRKVLTTCIRRYRDKFGPDSV